jgi:hypothetical protein
VMRAGLLEHATHTDEPVQEAEASSIGMRSERSSRNVP